MLVDGAQAAVHLDVDVRDIGCDFYVFTGHKLYGPTGIGVLYGKYEHLAAMPPFNGGGEMIEEVVRRTASPMASRPTGSRPARRRSCRRSGWARRIDYVNSIGKARIRAHETRLVQYAHERLGAINSLRIIGTAQGQGARSSPSRSRARIRTMSPPSSTARAWRCAPAPIA